MRLLIIDDIKRIKKNIPFFNSEEIIIASENVNIYKWVKEYTELQCIFIEPTYSLYHFLDETCCFVDEINKWIKKISTEQDLYINEIAYAVEGNGVGEIAQMISDILLDIQMWMDILQKKSIKNIIIDIDRQTLKYEILKDLAKKQDINIKYDIRKKITKESLKSSYLAGVISFVVRLKINFNTLKKIINRRRNIAKDYEVSFGMMMNSNSNKHIVGGGKMFSALKKTQDYVIICADYGTAYEYFLQNNINAICIYDFFELHTWCKNMIKYRKYRKLAKQHKNIFPTIESKGIDFTNHIKNKIMYYINTELLKYYSKDVAYKNLFQNIKINYIYGWRNSNCLDTRLCYENAKHETRKVDFFRIEPFGFGIVKPELKEELYRYRFFFGKSDLNIFANVIESKAKLANINASPWTEVYLNRKIKSETGKKLTLLWLPSMLLKGWTSTKTLLLNGMALIERIGQLDCFLYIKFHPNLDKRIIKEFERMSCKYNNIKIIEQYQNVYECIVKSDIVITDISTAILDGISSGRPVISLVDEMTYHFVKKIKGMPIYTDVESLYKFLESFIANKQYQQTWIKEILNSESEFFEQEFIMGENRFKAEEELLYWMKSKIM